MKQRGTKRRGSGPAVFESLEEQTAAINNQANRAHECVKSVTWRTSPGGVPAFRAGSVAVGYPGGQRGLSLLVWCWRGPCLSLLVCAMPAVGHTALGVCEGRDLPMLQAPGQWLFASLPGRSPGPGQRVQPSCPWSVAGRGESLLSCVAAGSSAAPAGDCVWSVHLEFKFQAF